MHFNRAPRLFSWFLLNALHDDAVCTALYREYIISPMPNHNNDQYIFPKVCNSKPQYVKGGKEYPTCGLTCAEKLKSTSTSMCIVSDGIIVLEALFNNSFFLRSAIRNLLIAKMGSNIQRVD
jgi:hypothetical protein